VVSMLRAELPTTHQAIRDLASCDESSALGVLEKTAAAEDQFLRRTAIEVIGGHPRGRELRSVVLSALTDPSEYVVRTVCDVVGQWALNEAHDAVVNLLTSASSSTRRSAIRALHSIWLSTDIRTLFHQYKNDADSDVRREAAWFLRRHVGPQDWRAVFEAFHVDELPRHRQWACELAAAFSGPNILPTLTRLSGDLDGHVRKAAARAIQQVSQHE
jgi:HEAT repeat protein